MHKKTHRTDKREGKPVLCQRTFSSVFRAIFFLHSQTAQFNLECVGPFKVVKRLLHVKFAFKKKSCLVFKNVSESLEKVRLEVFTLLGCYATLTVVGY